MDTVALCTSRSLDLVGELHVHLDGDAEASALLQVRLLELTSN